MSNVYTNDLIYRKLDADGDMCMGGSDAFLTKQDAMIQSIRTRIKLYAGEWWEGDDGAIDMFNDVLGKRRTDENRQMIDMLITARILDTVGVIRVSDVSSAFTAGRTYTYTCNVTTQYGTSYLEVEV